MNVESVRAPVNWTVTRASSNTCSNSRRAIRCANYINRYRSRLWTSDWSVRGECIVKLIFEHCLLSLQCAVEGRRREHADFETHLGVHVYLRLRSRKRRNRGKERVKKAPNHGGTILIARWERWDANERAADAAAIRNSAQCPPEQERPPSVAKSWVARIYIYMLLHLEIHQELLISK